MLGSSLNMVIPERYRNAHDAGLERVTTPFVAFVDTDVRAPAGWLEALLPHFDDRIEVVSGSMVTTSSMPGRIRES